MSLSTGIQWCDDTVNPVMGCDGCELWRPEAGINICYAGVLHGRHGGRNPGYAPTFDRVTLFPGRTADIARQRDLTGTTRLLKPWLSGQPRLIFVSDMGDALSKAVPFAYLEAEIIVPATSPDGSRHRWLWLSKQPKRMAKFSGWLSERGVPWPPNVWAGTSITTSNVERVEHLLRVGDERTVRFLSVEPQSKPVDLTAHLRQLDWVIQGGESGRTARPFDLAWVRDLRDQCSAAGVAYFLKQLGRAPLEGGRPLKLHDSHGGDWAEWPNELRVRRVPGATVWLERKGLLVPHTNCSKLLQGGCHEE